VVHRVVVAKLATRKSDGFVLSGKRTHRLAARTHEAPALVNKWTLNGAGSGSSVGLFGVRAFTTASSGPLVAGGLAFALAPLGASLVHRRRPRDVTRECLTHNRQSTAIERLLGIALI
jgi:hypothetical protein